VLASLFAEIAELLGGRLDKLPERRRPHYTPIQRWRILEIKRVLALSAEETARLFRVSIGTVLRWEAEAGREPEKTTIGSLLKPTPPLRRYADVVRHLVQRMDGLGFGSAEKIAATLARAGWRLARETVRRYRHEPPVRPQPGRARTEKATQPLRARHPNDLWFLDVTQVKGLFGLFCFRVAAVFDGFSRMPVALRVFGSEPRAEDMARLVAVAGAVTERRDTWSPTAEASSKPMCSSALWRPSASLTASEPSAPKDPSPSSSASGER
jgi:hypothetical protein